MDFTWGVKSPLVIHNNRVNDSNMAKSLKKSRSF